MPGDNNRDNLAHDHEDWACHDYADDVRVHRDRDPLCDQVLAWWVEDGRERVFRLDVAKRFGLNCRFAGDLLFRLRERDEVASTGKGGSWYRLGAAEREARTSRAPICPQCYMVLPASGVCLQCE